MSETIASVEEVKKANIILCSVSKKELLNNDYTRIFSTLNVLSEFGTNNKPFIKIKLRGVIWKSSICLISKIMKINNTGQNKVTMYLLNILRNKSIKI